MTIETAPRRTEYIPLDHLTPDSSNPKAHDLEIIDASVGRFGMIDQIVRDDRTGKIISGHGRHMALVSMRNRGETPPEGVRVDAGGHWLVPVVVGWSSRTDAEARAALVALNQTTILGGWVDDSLLDLLDNLSDFTGVGFDEDDLDDLRARLEEVAAAVETDDKSTTAVTRKDDVPTRKDSDNYAAEGRRLVILDYSVDEYPLIQARLRALRETYAQDSNAGALEAFLAAAYPDVASEPALADVDPIDDMLG